MSRLINWYFNPSPPPSYRPPSKPYNESEEKLVKTTIISNLWCWDLSNTTRPILFIVTILDKIGFPFNRSIIN